MEARHVAALPDGPGWQYEPKWDGFRAIFVLDGEIVVFSGDGKALDFDALLQRIHPAESRVRRLAKETPASLIAFDLLALGTKDLRAGQLAERRTMLEKVLADAEPPIHLSPC